MEGRYPVVTLCGSTRFKEEFMAAQKLLTLKGYIVISVGLFGHAGDEEVWAGLGEDAVSEVKVMLDDMHKRKIDMADGIFVINKNGYIGDSTRSEIAYAVRQGKTVAYLEDDETRRCPVCGKFVFPERHRFDICPVCGWEDDPLQRREEGLAGGANRLSLTEARKEYRRTHGDE